MRYPSLPKYEPLLMIHLFLIMSVPLFLFASELKAFRGARPPKTKKVKASSFNDASEGSKGSYCLKCLIVALRHL